ncbi:hypothetical protein KCU73_g6598, partial [Aureobasidium melanogenum]
MDIQLFENFALPPDSRMDIEIHENFSLPPGDQDNPNTFSAKREGDPALVDERPAKRPSMSESDRIGGVTEGQPLLKRARLSQSALDRGVKILAEHYKLDKGQEENLRLRAKEHKFVPTVDQVEWVVKEAKLREDNPKHKINLVMFAYMEYYPWYLRSLGSDHRVYVGDIESWRTENEIWISFDGRKSQLHFDSPKPGKSKDVFRVEPVFRRYFRWLASFDELFQLSSMKSEDLDDDAKAKLHADWHNAYIKATTKVLARFPGLILERHPDPDKPMHRIKLHGSKWSAFPFKCNEANSPENPLGGLFELLTTKLEKSDTPKKAGKSKASKKGAAKVIKPDESSEEEVEGDESSEEEVEGDESSEEEVKGDEEKGEGKTEEYVLVDEDEDLVMGDD